MLRFLLFLLHAYAGLRLAPVLGWPGAAALAFLLVCSWMLMPYGLGRRTGDRKATALAWAGLIAMGLFSSLLVATIGRDALLLSAIAIDAVRPGSFDLAGLRTQSAFAVLALAAFVTAWGFFNARRTAGVVHVDVPLADLPEALHGFSIAQISDVHVGTTIRRPYLDAIVRSVNRLDADMVAVTGDLVDGSVRDLADHVAPLAQLHSRNGSFFVTGNHEYYSAGAADAASWVRELRRLGLTVLLNEHVVLRRGDAAVVIAGVTDFSAGHFDAGQASDPQAALAGSPRAALRILLAHQPRSAEAAEAAGFDLQLSGHTHGGQFWPWNLLVRLQQPFTAGLKRWRGMWVYTSRGTGYWGPPKRFGAPSEITLLRLVPARVASGATA